MIEEDIYYMQLALREAKKALLKDEVPVGAVIVKDGQVIAKGHNLRESKQKTCSHAEIIAITKANKKLASWRLPGTTIYITIEPCSMCAGAILWSRIDRIVYGAKDIKGGALGSSYNLFDVPNINHRPTIKGGVLEEECQSIIKKFFKNKRMTK